MEEKLNGITLSAVSFGENDKILNIFTLEKGVISAKIKGVKKAGAKLKFVAEPFCFAEFIFSCSADKRTVIGASLIDSFYPVREDIIKFYSAGAVIEFVKKIDATEIASQELFVATVNALKSLAYGDNDAPTEVVKFLLSALKISGYALNLNGCTVCGKNIVGRVFFDYSDGGFLCEDCFNGRGREINPVTYGALIKSENGQPLNDEEGRFAVRLLEYYIVNKVEEKLNSLSELIKILS